MYVACLSHLCGVKGNNVLFECMSTVNERQRCAIDSSAAYNLTDILLWLHQQANNKSFKQQQQQIICNNWVKTTQSRTHSKRKKSKESKIKTNEQQKKHTYFMRGKPSVYNSRHIHSVLCHRAVKLVRCEFRKKKASVISVQFCCGSIYRPWLFLFSCAFFYR